MTAVHIYAPRPVETDMEARQWNAKAFNFPEYFAALQRAMQARNATPADVSRATGVSATTLTRMKEGRRPDAASLAALSAWAGLNPAAYVKASPATEDFDLPAQSDEVAAQPQQVKPLSDDGWQSISTAPKDGTLIIVREERCSAMAVMWVNGWKYESGNVSYLEPTHWMPLPPPPKD